MAHSERPPRQSRPAPPPEATMMPSGQESSAPPHPPSPSAEPSRSDRPEAEGVGHDLPCDADLFMMLAELTFDLVYIYDMESGRTEFLNRRARDILGVDPSDGSSSAGEAVRLEVHPDDLPLVRRRVDLLRSMRDGSRGRAADADAEELTYRLRAKDGTWRWLRGRERPLDQRAGRVLGIAHDITEAREREAALADAQARFITMADASPAFLWMGDAAGQMEFCNRSLSAYVGVGLDRLRLLDWSGFVHPDDLVHEQGRWAAAVEGQREYHHRYRLRRHDGEYRWVLSHVVPVKDRHGRTIRWIGSTIDIHDQVHAEEALRHSVERLRLAIDTSGVVVFNQDADLRYTWIYRPMLGHAPEDMVGRTDMDLFERVEDAARIVEIKRRVLATREAQRHLVELRHRGSALWFDLNVQPRFGSDGDLVGIIGACIDVSDMQRAIARRELLLKELNHRIKNSLQLVVSLLRLQMGEIRDKTTRQQFERACRRVTAIAELHGSLYLTEDISSLDFGAHLRALAPQLLEQVGGLGASVALEIVADDVMLDVDRAIPLSLIVNELLTNAVAHALAGRKSGSIGIGFRVADGEGHLWISDDGPGLPPAATERLGLRLVRALVAQIGGSMQISSRDGTRCDIRLPAS